MIQRLLFLTALLFCFDASAVAVRVTASVSITNAPTTNGQTLTVNGNVRTWTNNVVLTGSQILTNATIVSSKTNAYNQIALNQFSQVVIVDRGSTNFDLVGADGVNLTVTPSAGYALVTYTTNTVASLTAVRVPIAGEPSGAQGIAIAGFLVRDINALSTVSFFENSVTVSNLLGMTNAQTIPGIKQFTNVAGQFWGIVTNAPKISGNVDSLTNGYWRNGKIGGTPISSNLVNWGSALSSPNSGAAGSEQFGAGAVANNTGATAVGGIAAASGNISAAFGYGAIASGDSSAALGTASQATASTATALGVSAVAAYAGSTAIGASAATTVANQVMVGTSSQYAHFPGNVRIDGNTELTWKRFPVTSLANGNNAGVVVGTNTFIEVSGPTGAFTINGLAGGRDGKFLIVLNQTTFNMTIAHDSGTDPTAANRIYTMTGADRATTGNGAALLIYSGAASRWILVNLDL